MMKRHECGHLGLSIILTFIILAVSAFLSATAAQETARPLVNAVDKKFLGDLPEIKKRGAIRVLIPLSRTFYFIDDGVEKGIAAELLREFEKDLNQGIKSEQSKLRIILVPTRRDELISGIADGFGDIAVANLTITKERQKLIDFSNPFVKNVREVVVTSSQVPDLKSLDDLAGMEIHVRQSSSYYESLLALNDTLKKAGKQEVQIENVDERLEDEDLLEMLNANALPAIVMDEHKVTPWLQVFDQLKAHGKSPIREGAETGWAIRKNSPELKTAINGFNEKARQGTALGNILIKRYYSGQAWIKNPKNEAYEERLDQLLTLFKKYGAKYKIDPLLLAALSFQESRFDNDAKSSAGAVGIMQILPTTAADPNVGIKNVRKLENNIEAATKYIRFVADQYFSEGGAPEQEKILMALASYNAGPNRVARLRKKAKDPNKWSQSVEWEVARAVGAEPVKYVKNIIIYYVIFNRFAGQSAAVSSAKVEGGAQETQPAVSNESEEAPGLFRSIIEWFNGFFD